MKLPLVLIAAVARNGVIGHEGGMPWHLPSDLAHFRESTMGRPLIVGRRTFEAIGRPLPGRFMVVMSRDPTFRPPGVELAAGLEEAITKSQATGRAKGSDAIMVAGGGAVYRAAIEQADALLITEVMLNPPGDTTFPPIDATTWKMVAQGPQRCESGDEAAFRLVRYQRSHASGAFDPEPSTL